MADYLRELASWLQSPLDGAAPHLLAPHIAWHGRLMMLAWGLIAPVAILGARYLKRWPGQQWPERLDHQGWWYLHRLGQMAAVALTLSALLLLWCSPAAGLVTSQHRWFAWSVVTLAVFQVLSGVARGSKGGPTASDIRGDHFDMTPRRLWFERLHKGAGYLALAVACGALLTGMFAANAPKWMVLLTIMWWLTLGVLALYWQRRGRCLDTYQAIWGNDPTLPGNQIPPIGWGIRRIPPSGAPSDNKGSSS